MIDIITIASIPAILALVNLAKNFGVTGKWSSLLAVVLGIALQVADATMGTEPVALTAQGLYPAVGAGLILGLSAAGLYDVAATAGGPKAEPATDFVEPELESDEDSEPEEYTPERVA